MAKHRISERIQLQFVVAPGLVDGVESSKDIYNAMYTQYRKYIL